MSVLAELRAPGPTITALTRPFWDAAAKGVLLLQRCEACREAAFYPRAICPHCWSPRLRWEASSGRGALRSFSVVHKPGHPAWRPIAPFTVGLVRLEEGPVMTSLILASNIEPSVGAPVELQPTEIGGRVLPAFAITQRGAPEHE
jgi:uncharacterized OB-fold protein